jgi:hypothetical protein
MNNFVKDVIEEKFASKAQQRLFFAKGKKSKKWREWANEFADKTDFNKIPEKVKEENPKEDKEQMKLSDTVHNGNSESEFNEIVNADGDIQTGDEPGNLNAYIRSKKTSDQVAKASMGQMGSFGVLGGATGANKTLKYWAEADMSKALGAPETIGDPSTDYEDAVETFEDDLDVPEDEAKERAKQMGYDPELPDGKIRLIENPKKYIEEYLAKKSKVNDLVKKKVPSPLIKKEVSPVIKRQLKTIKQTLRDNGLSMSDITEYLEDNE